MLCWADDFEELQGLQPGYDFYLVRGRPHWCEATELELQLGLLQPEDIRWGLNASGHVAVERYRAACNILREGPVCSSTSRWLLGG